MAPVKAAVLLSGGGRTLQNLLTHIQDADLPLEIRLVLSSKPKAYGLVRAQEANLPTEICKPSAFASTADYTEAVFSACSAAGAEWVLLAGFLRLLCPIPPRYQGRVLNIHPSLIPAFCGKGFYGNRVHEAVLQAGVSETGCTVHFVDDEYDHGPIILQRKVPVLPGDDPASLAARVFAAECEAYPEAIRRLANQS